MTIQVKTPDGGTAEFPDGTSPDSIRSALRSKFGGGPAKEVGKQIQDNYSLGTLSNVTSSAIKAGTDIYNTVRHPIQTIENLGSLAKGISQKLGLSSGKDSVQYADAAWDYLKDRYGSLDAIKKSFHDDPVGVLLDASTVLSGGEALAARLPVVGERVASAARAVNPVNVATKSIGTGATKVLGMTTGAESDAIRQAFKAGKAGGAESQAFTEQMRGQASGTELVSDARTALGRLREQRGAAYIRDMESIKESKQVLPFDKIDQAIDKVFGIKRFKGKDTQRSAAGVRNQINEVISEWRTAEPREFHTAEGLDALKQTIGDLRDGTEFNSPARVVANEVYHAIRKTIADAFPKYGDVMKGYEKATEAIQEVEKTLSLNPKANVDTSLRKITSAFRNNVNTNFGRRQELVEFLAKNGAPHLLAKIAGQALNTATPRGLVGRLGAMGVGAEMLTALATSDPLLAIKLSVAIIGSSPRVVGEAAHAAGQASRLPVRNIGLGLRALSPGSGLEQSGP